MKIKATKDIVTVTEPELNFTGEFKARECTVELSADYDGLSIGIVFIHPDGTVYSGCLVSGKVDIPPSTMPGIITIGVYGYTMTDGNLTRRLSPHPCKIFVGSGSYAEGEEPPTPTPGTFAQLSAAIAGKEDTANKVTELSDTATDTQYPSAKCVYDNFDEFSGSLNDIVSNIETEFSKTNAAIAVKEDTANKVTELSDTATDTQYPSAKCVYANFDELSSSLDDILSNIDTEFSKTNAAIAVKEDTANKVTELSDTATNTQYPSAAAVYAAIQTALYVDSEAVV